jgi:hypothetical protein
VICDLEFGICDLEFGICDLEFGICDLEFVIWNLFIGICSFGFMRFWNFLIWKFHHDY